MYNIYISLTWTPCTVFWEISVFNNFHMLKVPIGNFSHHSICTEFFQDEISWLNIFVCPGHKCMHITHGGVRKRLLYLRLPRIQRDVWRAAIGEELECDRELDNSCDRYSEESTWQLELLLVHYRSYRYSHSPERTRVLARV